MNQQKTRRSAAAPEEIFFALSAALASKPPL
jgi:hypothetical protein